MTDPVWFEPRHEDRYCIVQVENQFGQELLMAPCDEHGKPEINWAFDSDSDHLFEVVDIHCPTYVGCSILGAGHYSSRPECVTVVDPTPRLFSETIALIAEVFRNPTTKGNSDA